MSDNEAAPGAEAGDLAEAWTTFTDSLRELGLGALASAPNQAEQLDGLRFILRQLAYREEQFLEFPAGTKPELFFAESPTRKVFADCPDTIYHQFSVAKGGTYRISGTRGESPYISFTAYRAGVVDRVVADLHDGELDVDPDGTFSLTVGGPELASNWLDLGADAAFVIIREYTHDRANGVKATFEVEQLSPALSHRPELDTQQITSVLGLLGVGLDWVNAASVRLSEELRLRPNVMNEAGADLVSEMAGTPHNHYQLCYVKLEPGQALELELRPPECRYWSVHLNNWWLESPEFRDGQSVCVNDAQAERQPDGTVKMLVGPDDPGGGNWLDTKGRTETILLARYLLPEDELPPIITNLITL
ncbi:MAG: DUF1214 domain-containing protein [Acidimicrobiales bacterium]